MKKYKNWIIGGVIALIMLIPLIKEISDNLKPIGISYEEFKEILKEDGERIVYIGSSKEKNNKTILDSLDTLKEKTNSEYKVLESDRLTTEEKADIIKLNAEILEKPAYVYIKDKEIVGIRSGVYSPSDLEVLSGKYFDGKTEDINYNVAIDAQSFIDRAKEDKVLMVVFGRTSCPYCEAFKPTYNELATKYNIDIYYFDSDFYDAYEYAKVLNEGYEIIAVSPSTGSGCTDSGKNQKLSEGFGTPTTLFIKGGKTVDCIVGQAGAETVEQVFAYNKVTKIGQEKETPKEEKTPKKSTKKK